MESTTELTAGDILAGNRLFTASEVEKYLGIPRRLVRAAFLHHELDLATWEEHQPPAFYAAAILRWIEAENVEYRVSDAGRMRARTATTGR